MQPGTTLNGRYQLLARLSEGGAHVLYEARDRDSGESVAITVCCGLPHSERPGAWTARAFATRAEAAMQVVHPNIVRVLDADWVDAQTPYAVMEYLRGEPFDGLFHGATGFPERYRIATDLLSGLAAIHGAGYVHLRVTPMKLLLQPGHDGAGPIPVLLGFCEPAPGLVQQQYLVGSRWGGVDGYAAPEQFNGSASLDQRTDVFGAGASLYELLTAASPLEDNMVAEPRTLVGPYRPRELYPEIDAALSEVIERATQPDPAARFADARAMEQAWRSAMPAGPC